MRSQASDVLLQARHCCFDLLVVLLEEACCTVLKIIRQACISSAGRCAGHLPKKRGTLQDVRVTHVSYASSPSSCSHARHQHRVKTTGGKALALSNHSMRCKHSTSCSSTRTCPAWMGHAGADPRVRCSPPPCWIATKTACCIWRCMMANRWRSTGCASARCRREGSCRSCPCWTGQSPTRAHPQTWMAWGRPF